MPSIDLILEKAPAKISRHTELENKAYADMLKLHEQYKRERAKKYLQRRANEGTVTIKDLEYALDTDEELNAIKDKELLAEIDYRANRERKEYYENEFQSACERGRNVRSELRGLSDTIKKEEQNG